MKIESEKRERLKEIATRFKTGEFDGVHLREARVFIEQALRGRETEPEPVWRPIETAPMDGTEVLVFTPMDGVVSSAYRYGCWQKLITVMDGGNTNEPTHWMPLPEPPEGT